MNIIVMVRLNRTKNKRRRTIKSYSKRINRKKHSMKGGSTDSPQNIDNVALLIPVHPKHYKLVYNILNTLKNNNIQIDVHLIFSNRSEYDIFEMKDLIKEIIAENVPNDDTVIEYKKFYGLNHMINTQYDYIILCDSESDIIPENFTKDNITAKIEGKFNKKKLYGIAFTTHSYTGMIKQIMGACANVFKGDEYTKIESSTKNLTLYTFYYDIPVYKRDHIRNFLDKVNYNTLKLTWFHFDYLIYDYYLIVSQGFEIVDVTQIASDNDVNGMYVETSENFDKLKELGFGFGIAGSKFWKLMRDRLMGEKTFLIVNTDRPS